jgi:ADP-ribose pyrophosphatase YjhB (NUDIX family)
MGGQAQPAAQVAGRALVIVDQGRLLLQRQPKDAPAYANMWDLPQVAVDAGAAPEDAALEVARAELGITVTAFSLLAAGDDLVGDQCWRRLVYRVDGFEGEVGVHDANRRWFSEKEFADVFQLNPLVAAVPVFGG